MIQQCIQIENFIEAKQLLNELRQVLNNSRNAPITYYLNKEVIEKLAKGLGVHSTSLFPPVLKVTRDEASLGDDIEEVIEE